jgi:hypothetical protein
MSLNFEDVLLDKENYSNLKNNFYLNNKITNRTDLENSLKKYKFRFNILDKNRFNNKSIQDQYLFFSHKIIFKSKNESNIEIFFSSNKGKIYYTSINLENCVCINPENLDFKLNYLEIPENPHSKNIFSIIDYGKSKLLFISADGVISLFNHNTKFFEMDVKTIKFRPLAFVQNSNREKNLFFYDESNNLLKYNYKKVNNGLQAIVRKPLKIKNSDERTFPFLKKNENGHKKEIKDCLKIKNCIQSKFNENIFALLEYNYISKSYSISVYDFESDTRIYRRDLLFKVKSMKFAFERKFKNIQELIENRDDLRKSQNKQINNIDNFLNEFNLREDSDCNSEKFNMDIKVDNTYDMDLEFDVADDAEKNPERKEFTQFENEDKINSNKNYFINNDFNLDLNENHRQGDKLPFSDDQQNKGNEKDKIIKNFKSKNNKKVKSKKLFENYDEKKYIFAEKFKQTVQQIFNENNNYELLHILDKDNNYIIIDYMTNKCNNRKLNNVIFDRHKKKVSKDQTNTDVNSCLKYEQIDKTKENSRQNFAKSKYKSKKILMIPFDDIKRNSNKDEINKESSEDIIVIKLENNYIKFGIVNQLEDFYFANINLIDNSLSFNSVLNHEENNAEGSENNKKNLIIPKKENLIHKFSMDIVYIDNNSNNCKLPSPGYKNYIVVTLENETNLRIVKIGNSFLDLLAKYNIILDIDNYHQRNRKITNLLTESSTSCLENKKNESNSLNIRKNDRTDNYDKNCFLSQKFYKNFSNVPANDIKIFYLDSNDRNKIKISIIASLIDNSIKYFELILDDSNLSDHQTSNLNLKFSINAHISKIQDIIFISETIIASVSYDQSLKIWDMNKCKLIDLPILNNNNDNNFSKFNPVKENSKMKNAISNDSLSGKNKINKIFPIFTKVVNEAIYSQSYASSNEFINNFSSFYLKLNNKIIEIKKDNLNNNISNFEIERLIGNLYIEFIPILNESSSYNIDKKDLDYLIFTFSGINSIDKKIIYYLIKYELIKNHNDIVKINTKNMQTLFCLIFYIFIFNFNTNLNELYQIFLKIKIRIQTALQEYETKQKENQENNPIIHNENNPRFYSNLLNKVNFIIKFIDNEIKMFQDDNINNIEESRFKNLINFNEIIFNDLPLRAKFFELLINNKYKEACLMLEENELYFESLILTKLVNNEESNNRLNFNNNYLVFKDKLNKFRAFIYSKQIYQAQKCQSVINILNEIYNSNEINN